MKRIAMTLLATCALAGFSSVQADDAWLTDFRKADLNDSGGLSKVELDKSKSTRLKPLRDNFAAIDADGDGHVTPAEYERFLGKAMADFEAKFRKADLNDSDGLSRKELEKVSGRDFDVIRKNFDAMDIDRDGQVSFAEYQKFSAGGAQAASRATSPVRDQCRPDCGVVVAVDRYKIEGEGSLVGALAGGVAGGLLGSQVGGGSGKTIATVGGAAGGAYAGHQVEKKLKTRKMVKVTVKFDNGQQRDFEYEAETSPFPQGARVQLRDGQLQEYRGQ